MDLNMISGTLYLLDRPFVLGDLVEVGGIMAALKAITMPIQRGVVTPDARCLASQQKKKKIPIQVVINYNRCFLIPISSPPQLIFRLPLAVQENLGRVRSICLSMCHQNISLLMNRPAVIVTDLNDTNVGHALQVWLDDKAAYRCGQTAL